MDATGKVVETATIYPHQPRNDWDGSLHALGKLAEKHNVSLIAIGNGTASRETDKLAQDLIKRHPELKLTTIVVSEAGASVYSASEFASRELPEHGCVAARRGFHRAPLAGSVGGTGEDRSEIDRRRPIPARRGASPAGALARCGGRGLRERGRRGCEHRLAASAGARFRAQPARRAKHRRLPRRRRARSPHARRCEKCRAWAKRPSSRRRASCAS